jgi:leader peptidase (prepilin peptidase)/N-methyltransferase
MPLANEQVYLLAGTVFAYGLLFGSFFNVLIYRLPREENVIFPASHCPTCKNKISWAENIPVFCFLFLRGKCGKCKAKIPLQYPLVELATGIYSLLLFFIFLDKIQLALSENRWNLIEIFLQYFTLLLFIPLTIIDIKHYIIPDEITIPGFIIAFLFSFLPGGITPLGSLVGALVGGGFLLSAGLIGKLILKRDDTMGGGDIKFLLWIGALFGFQTALAAIFIGSAVGSVISVSLILFKKAENDKHVPFGPYLCAGALIFFIFGKEILSFF